MQYVLTQEELDALKGAAEKAKIDTREQVQRLCTLVALHMPVPRRWSSSATPTPWGCILVDPNKNGYCDDCPAQEDCPHPHKRWSK
jgi:hypothetical protein